MGLNGIRRFGAPRGAIGIWAVRLSFVVALAVLVSAGFPAQARNAVETPAKFAVMIDAETGMTLFEKNADELMAPASMSKLMTLVMVFDRLKTGEFSMDTEIPITVNAWRRGGAGSGSSTMFAKVNSNVPLSAILRGIIVQSGNDACIAVAEYIGGTEAEFANMMTERAREMGLMQATFANSTGWPNPNHRVTARELATIARYIITQYPEYYSIFSEKSFKWNNINQSNRNPLIHIFPGGDGLKTGHTEESGYGVVGSAVRNGERLILVINGLNSERARATESKRLMAMGFGSFVKEEFYSAGDEVALADIYYGEKEVVPLVLKDKLVAYSHRASLRKVESTVTYKSPLIGPVKAGQEVGLLTVQIPGQQPYSVPVYAARDVERLGFWGRWSTWATEKIMGEKPPVPEAKSVKAYRRQE